MIWLKFLNQKFRVLLPPLLTGDYLICVEFLMLVDLPSDDGYYYPKHVKAYIHTNTL
jgi:hypothetical protein